MQKQKGVALLVVIIIILAVILIAGGAIYYYYATNMQPKPVACTMEAKICPDGSSVGRGGPNCEFASCPSQIIGWKIYKNFGIEFQYPDSWGSPQETTSADYQQINFDINPSVSSFSASIQPFLNPTTGQTETLDQMMSRYLANDKYINSINDISANSIKGKEIIFNSAVDGKPYSIEAFFPFDSKSFVSFSADIKSIPVDMFNKIIFTFKLDNASVVKKDPATGLLIYKNNGIQFEYPEKFNTNYASLNLQVSVQKIDNSKMDSNGCYPGGINGAGNANPTTLLTINNTKFCYTTSSDVGAGQLYTSYDYTTFSHGNAYIIDYVVHTSNGCGAYANSTDINAPGNERYKECLDFGKNYESIVTKPIQDSIATFKFINQ